MENEEQVFKLFRKDLEIQKLIGNLETLVAFSEEHCEKLTKAKVKAKIDKLLRRNISDERKINSSIALSIRPEN